MLKLTKFNKCCRSIVHSSSLLINEPYCKVLPKQPGGGGGGGGTENQLKPVTPVQCLIKHNEMIKT